ncbi:hypothetical protein PR048_005973 [Dryococelus australis]|uniref:Uncharacterized protein n=1 Tax=Dryococelus australis TaxID=614101 RepID=A0ABQ9I9P8_9NEOP|nr:hypothetical protein PR048_005973 [Dryococelus australis]
MVVVCRSMGILLPPVSQVTMVTTLTMHHRNRSLDSALQRIPEVDVTPSPECEPPGDIPKPPCTQERPRDREEITSLGSDDSGILCGSDSGSGGTSAVNRSRESLDSNQAEPMEVEQLAPAVLCCTRSEKETTQVQGAKGFLLRLFESKMFDMSMAITYLFNSKEPGVQSYIG